MSSSSDLTGVAGWAVSVMESLGGPGAGLLIALENLFPPLPSEIILPLAGFTASQGTFTLGGAILWTTLGSVIGALALFLLGAALGRARFRSLWARLPLVNMGDLDRTEEWFARHGGQAVFLGRMIPIFRSLISVPAGIEGMPMPKFLLLTAAGSGIWNTLFVVAGYQLGENWHLVETYAGLLQTIVLVVVAALVAWWVVQRVRTVRAREAGSSDGGRV